MKILETEYCENCTYEKLLGGFKSKIVECDQYKTMKTLKQHIKTQGRNVSWIAEQIDISQPLLSMQLSGKATLQPSVKTDIIKLLSLDEKQVI